MRALIVKLSSLGDIIHTLPAYNCLREEFEKVGWVASRRSLELVEAVEGLGEVILNPLEGGNWSQLRGWDVVVDFQGLLKSGFLTWASRSKRRFGFSSKLAREPLASLFYTDRLKEFRGTHVIEKNLALSSLVLGRDCFRWEFPLRVEENPEVEEWFRGKIILSVGASWQSKRLPPDKWGEIGKEFEKRGYRTIFLWGTSSERKEAEEAARMSGGEVSPFLSIREVISAVSASLGAVSPDSFVLHLASALGKPALGIYGPTFPERNGPWGRAAVISSSLPCAPCWKRKCKTRDCMREIQPAEVVENFLSLILV